LLSLAEKAQYAKISVCHPGEIPFYDNEFSVREGFILNTYFSMKNWRAEVKAFG